MSKPIKITCLSFALITFFVTGVFAWNYVSLHIVVSKALNDDPRNEPIIAWAYFQHGVDAKTLVFDLRVVTLEAASIDGIRVLIQTAKALKDRDFDQVILAYQGRPKFKLDGAYFKTLGVEAGVQNPVYTMRTLPENVRRLDGTPAFDTWSGGVLGVLGKQIQDLNRFSSQWFVSDVIDTSK